MSDGSRFIVALGSNRSHFRHGRPPAVVRAVMEELAALGTVTARSAVIASEPLGPSARRYANAALVLETERNPERLLVDLKAMERAFGRRRTRRWGARVLDLDIVLWSGGGYASRALTIPHPALRIRPFVLGPARDVAPGWRDPMTGLTLRQLHARLTRARPTRRLTAPRTLPRAPLR